MPILKKRTLGIDIGTSAVKIVHSSGSAHNWKVGTAQLPEGVVAGNIVNSAKLLAATVKRALSSGHISGRQAALSLSGSDVIIRHAVLPRMNADQLRQNVIDEIAGYLSVNPELYYIDYKIQEVLTNGAAQQYKVMIAAVPRNVIAGYVQALASAGIKVSSVDVAANAKEKLINALVGSVRHFAVLDLGMSGTVIDTYQNNQFFISKISQVGVGNTAQALAVTLATDPLQAMDMLYADTPVKEATEAITTYTDQVALDGLRVLDYFRSRNNQQPVENIYVCGGGAGIPGICSILQEKFDMPVTSIANVMAKVIAQGHPQKAGDGGLAVYATAAGATLTEVDG